MEAVGKRIRCLADRLRERLEDIHGVSVCDQGRQRAGIVTFVMEGQDPQALADSLREQGINLSVSVPETSRMDLEARGLGRLMRASVHAYNTHAELEQLAAGLEGGVG